ncbi:dimethylargininase [Micromonospora siamensis]|uniref:N-Dimethylarginine dimethylaminohydrolase n=1 Tax=Micromonospora siamensis TaxID=299152 RepID=A0A1C5J9E9_9ACTN|nr:dimethylargininase [Micromonospora siamensis]SCG66646.1 N-Dimethylarginine dimethylaminohydrolase [Micromonospora siamensis]
MPQDPHPRTASRRHYLMCPPTYFTVSYSINPWMHPDRPTDTDVAVAQWERLRDLFLDLGHRVDLIEPIPGLPDMVYAANGATVLDDKVVVANFRHAERAGESAAYKEWFQNHGDYDVVPAAHINEGEGDYLVSGTRILAGTGFRSDPAAHQEAEDVLGAPVVGLTLVDPRYYHLDTALSILTEDLIAYLPEAFAPASREVLAQLYPDAVIADPDDAAVFGLNAVSDGRHVVLPKAADRLAAKLAERGFEPVGVDLSELLKGGGSAKCCTLELRHADPTGAAR